MTSITDNQPARTAMRICYTPLDLHLDAEVYIQWKAAVLRHGFYDINRELIINEDTL